jgi:hypothetical protein
MGLADNLVYIDELLDMLRSKLSQLICLYCEKTFKSHGVLKQHIRKKRHLRLHPHNTGYDKFYMVNYLEEGKGWHDVGKEDESGEDQEEEWDSWEGEGEETQPTPCLFCPLTLPTPHQVLTHCKVEHGYQGGGGQGFYSSIQLVNYIRKRVAGGMCPACDEKLSQPELAQHIKEKGHHYPPTRQWEDPQYLVPTLPNDPLLQVIGEEGGQDSEGEDTPPSHVIIEDPLYDKDDLLQRYEQISLALNNHP